MMPMNQQGLYQQMMPGMPIPQSGIPSIPMAQGKMSSANPMPGTPVQPQQNNGLFSSPQNAAASIGMMGQAANGLNSAGNWLAGQMLPDAGAAFTGAAPASAAMNTANFLGGGAAALPESGFAGALGSTGTGAVGTGALSFMGGAAPVATGLEGAGALGAMGGAGALGAGTATAGLGASALGGAAGAGAATAAASSMPEWLLPLIGLL